MNKIPFSKVNEDTKRLWLSLTPIERINFKLNVYWKNWAVITDNNLILMECVSAFINQQQYVVSGQCRQNHERWIRERH